VKYDNLTRAEQDIYNRAITRSHERRIHVKVLTLDGHPVASLTPHITDGQVSVDVTNDVSTRILTTTFVDPTRSLNFEPDAGAASFHRKFMVQVVDSRGIAELEEWIDCDVHTGPIWDFTRTGGECSLTAHGVDRLAMGTVRHPMQWGRHAQKTDVIRELLAAAGATHLGGIPDRPATTGHRVTAGFAYEHHKKHHPAEHGHKAFNTRVTSRKPRTDTYLELAKHISDSMNRHLYANAAGRFILRTHPNRPVLHVNHQLLSDPQLQRPGVDSPNYWLLVGGKPHGAKKQVRAIAQLPPAHPLSPESLAWHGKPYVIEERIENPHVKRAAEARAIVRRHRDRAARYVTDYEFDMLPVPWLDEYDLVSVHTPSGTLLVSMKQWSYPLTSTPMHVGGVKPTRYRPPVKVRGIS
jgi:hypothetical protein